MSLNLILELAFWFNSLLWDWYMCVNSANRYLVVCFGWLTEDWTNDRGRWISLNSGFIVQILHKRYISVEITFAVSRHCSLCWVSKVCVVESLRLSCLLVCGDSTSRRWGWSLCLVNVAGCYMTERDLFWFIIHTKLIIIIPTIVHESIHRMLLVLRLSLKWKKGLLCIGSTHSEMSMKFVKK